MERATCEKFFGAQSVHTYSIYTYRLILKVMKVPVIEYQAIIEGYIAKYGIKWIYNRKVVSNCNNEEASSSTTSGLDTKRTKKFVTYSWYMDYNCHRYGKELYKFVRCAAFQPQTYTEISSFVESWNNQPKSTYLQQREIKKLNGPEERRRRDFGAESINENVLYLLIEQVEDIQNHLQDGKLEKMDKDFSPQVDVLLPETEALAKQGKINEALEKLMSIEKQARNAADQASTGRILVQIVKLCHEVKDWKLLNEQIVLLSKKHGQLKAATSLMVQEAMTYLDSTPDMETKLELIETLRTVTDGKIYVEVERARITRLLAKIREDEGKMTEAADILQELQVETFGSMDKREKVDFILEQMRLCLAKSDYVRTQIISKKINIKFFQDKENEDLKLRFYNLMIQHALHEEQYLNVHKFYKQIYDSESIKEDETKWKPVLQNAILFVILSPFDNEQSDYLHKIYQDTRLAQIPQYQELTKHFVTSELMRWSQIEENYGQLLSSSTAFNKSTEEGQKRLKELHNRVVEHNIRVIAKYYTRITTKRLTQLLDLNEKDAEEFLSKLVVSKTIYARIDRSAGIINFQTKKDANEILNNWSSDINSLLNLIEKTCHLISKEEMVHSIAKVK